QQSTIFNCVFQYAETGVQVGIGSTVDFAGSQPEVGQVSYIRAQVFGLGTGCTIPGVTVEFALPSGVSLAVSPSAPIRCHYMSYDDPDNPTYTELSGVQCPQTVAASEPGYLWYVPS